MAQLPNTPPALRAEILARLAVRMGAARGLRKAVDLSQSDVARHLGMSQAAISRYEAGSSRPTGQVGARYLAFLAQLMGGER